MLPEPAGAVGDWVAAGVVKVGAAVSPPLACWVRWTTTFGASTEEGGVWAVLVGTFVGVAGVVAAGVVAVVVVLAGGSLTGVVVVTRGGVVVVSVGVVLVVVVCVVVSGADVVEVPVVETGSVGGSLARAAPESGPPSPIAVNPPPASTETIARRAHRRASLTPDMLDPYSSWFRPLIALEQGARNPRTPP
jgi:hypothetical protein